MMSSSIDIDPAADGKILINQLYHGAVITAFAMGYARLGKMAFGGSAPRLDLTLRDAGMVVVDVTLSMATKEFLVKQGILPANLLK